MLKSLSSSEVQQKESLWRRGPDPGVIIDAHSLQRMVSQAATIDWEGLEPVVAEIDPLMIARIFPPERRQTFPNSCSSRGRKCLSVNASPLAAYPTETARLFRGFQRNVERPDDYKYFSENVRLFQEIFKTR